MEQPVITFPSRTEFENWLSNNSNKSNGIWVRFYKKDSGLQTFNYDEALDIALCYGWIDGQVKRHDSTSYLQRFTPRRKRSPWSKRNTERVARLIQAGKMKPAGIAEIDRAKSDGRWDKAYAPPSETVIPSDFQKALNKNAKANAFWEKLNKTNRYAMIWQIDGAKKEETRTRRIEKFIQMLEIEEKLY